MGITLRVIKMIYPEPTTDEPELNQLEEWMDEGVCSATDGCFPVEPDGVCEHGYPSWLIEMGMI